MPADVDLTDPAMALDPAWHYAEWRRGPRVRRCDVFAATWMVHRFDDVQHVLKSPALFSVGAATSAGFDDHGRATLTMAEVDPPAHGRLRRAVASWLTPRAVEPFRQPLRERACELLEPLRRERTCEVVAAVALPLPAAAMAELFGVSSDDRADFLRAVTAMGALTVRPPDRQTDHGDARRVRMRHSLDGIAALSTYFAERVNGRPVASPGIVEGLARSVADGALTRDEAVASCMLMVLAGTETTGRHLANLVLTLACEPDQRNLVAADRTRLAPAIEETMRYEPAVHALRRVARIDSRLGEQTIRAGDGVLAMLGAANRDPTAFQDPDTYDISRRNARHVGLGAGVHQCAGIHLARLVAWAALTTLLEVAPSYRLGAEPPTQSFGNLFPLFRSPDALQISR